MKKLLYLAIVGDVDSAAASGVYTKVLAQVSAIQHIGKDCKALIGGSNFTKKYNCQATETVDLNDGFLGVDIGHFFDVATKQIDIYEPDILYIRYPLAWAAFVRFIFRVKKKYPHTKILIEKQTLEVRELLSSISARNILLALQEIFFRKTILKKVDCIVGVTNQICQYNSKLGALNTIYMGNGIDSELIKYKPCKNFHDNQNITITYVGNISRWTALDGFIEYLSGLDFLIDSRRVKLNVIGGGRESSKIIELAKNIEQITFHGYLKGDTLCNVVASSDWCLGSFGNGRRGLTEGSNLKLRLYCALGIPFIYFEYDSDFDSENIPESVLFYEKLGDHNELYENVVDHIKLYFPKNRGHHELIAFAQENLTWEVKFKKLFMELKY